ncbi:NAD(P)-binding protein [Sphingomonas sp. CGMCC 1.13654]|uniref:NAD(P)-binding protein n=1 Tax=Sphingomonas chungangi TaxID=2683589 RepID=A0A838L4N3_9SPHN|nr:NAD(P)-binding protein [Sphingomonas chungangi]MBA2934331.1 NAD(P)-binding protein [Sphingomonas chungangi]MVW57371.1 NAD(P)-binding protein [Sphingomonas chungangi]
MSEIAIVGGGLAGGAAATLLARESRRVILLERDAEPAHRICGEFISGDAAAMLDRLGLDLERLGATRMDRMRIVSETRTITAPLPFAAFGLTRKRLDSALLDLAAAAGARIERGVAARKIEGRRVESRLGTIDPGALLLASGKHDVRGAPRPTEGCDQDFVGFKTYWRLGAAATAGLRGHIEILLFPDGYAGLQLVEGGLANLCLLVRKSRFTEMGGGWSALLNALLKLPRFALRLADGEQILEKPLAIAGVPYGFVHRASPGSNELAFRLGDQAAVIPSFCGDGMAIALHSARRAAETLMAGGGPDDHHHALHADLAGQVRLAMRIQRIGGRERLQSMLLGAISLAPALLPWLAQATRVRT